MEIEQNIFDEIVARRRSLRAFLPEPVERELLDRLFTVAARTPSNCNTQPWVVHVASGDSIESLRETLPGEFMAGKLSMDFPYDGNYEGVFRERQYGAAQALYDSLGIRREEKERRQREFMRNFTFFGAPHVAFLFLPEPFGLREAADVGMFAQTLMLAMTAHGLGSCPQTALGFQADLVREKLNVAPNYKLLFGISFGYPDPDAPVNTCSTSRAALEDFVTYHS